MKIAFIDLETTGIDPVLNGVRQIGAIFEVDGKEIARFNQTVKPFPLDVIDQDALDVSDISMAEVLKFQPPELVYKEFIKELDAIVDKYDRKDKLIFIGYNSRFDDSFLREWFRKAGNKYYGSYFWWPAIDVSNMAMVHLMGKRQELENFKLGTVAKTMGFYVDETKAHDAMYDIELTKELFKMLRAE